MVLMLKSLFNEPKSMDIEYQHRTELIKNYVFIYILQRPLYLG